MGIRKIILEFIGGFLISIIAYLPVTAVVILFGLNFGRGDMIFLSIFLGYPLGSILGILLADKIVFRNAKINIIQVATCVLLSVVGAVGVYFVIGIIMAGLGGAATLVIPGIITFLSLLGYNIPLLLTGEADGSK